MKTKSIAKLPPQEEVAQIVSELEIKDFFDWYKKHPESYIQFLRVSPHVQRTYLQACGLLQSASVNEKTGFSGYSLEWNFDQWKEFISYWPKLSIFRSSAPKVCVEAFQHLSPDLREKLKRHFGEITFTTNWIEGMTDDQAFDFITSKFSRYREIKLAGARATSRELERYQRATLRIRVLQHFVEIERKLINGAETGLYNILSNSLSNAVEKAKYISSLKGKLPAEVKVALMDSRENKSKARAEFVRWGNDVYREIFLNLLNGKFQRGDDTRLWYMPPQEIKQFIDLVGINQTDLSKLHGFGELLKAKFLLSYPEGTPEQLNDNLLMLQSNQSFSIKKKIKGAA